MKKITLILVLCLSAAGPSFAQNNMDAMKTLTINALMEYGQSLYERGDYNEATAVFHHVLAYDSHQMQALKYIKEMGQPPVLSSSPVTQPVAEEPDVATLKAVDGLDTESLKQAIEAKKQSIEKLRAQIIQLRANIASQSAAN